MNAILDNTDNEILQQLEVNGRQSSSSIARKIRSNKTLVNYRLQRLKKRRIITGFKYLTNQVILGKLSFGLLIRFKDLLREQEYDLIRKYNKIRQVSWSASINGRWDAIVVIIEKDFESFHNVLESIISISEENIKEYEFYIDYEGAISSHKYLHASHIETARYHSGEKYELKPLEKEIYDLLKKDP